MTISGGVSTRQQFLGINYATSTNGQATLLNNKGVDASGTKHLTAHQRHATMADGFKKAHGHQATDQAHKNQAAAANHRAGATYAQASANGNITKHEQRNINSANRDATIANKQVGVDDARKHLGHVKANAARDGRITPGEQQHINGAQGNLNRLQGELNTLKSKDARLDARDAKHNTLGHKIGSAIQDSIGIGKKVAPSWGGPSAALPKPHIHTGFGGSAHVSMGCGGVIGGSLGCIKPNFNGGGHVHIGAPPRNLGFGQQLNMMAQGNAKAQYTGRDFSHQMQANNANANVRNTYSNARADGKISMFERRDINNANRDANIANKQVSYDTQRRHVGNLEKNFAADGRLSFGERIQLGSERSKLGSMGRELSQLKSQDRAQDARDTAFKSNPFNQFANAIGVGSTPTARPPFHPMPLPRPIFSGIAAGAAAAAQGLANLQSAHTSIASAAFAGASAAGLAISSAANFARTNLTASWGATGSFSSSFSSSSSWSSSSSQSFSVNVGAASFSGSASVRVGGGIGFRW